MLAAGVSSVHVAPDAAHRLDVAGARFTYPAVNAAAVVLLALAALGAAVLFVTARAAWRQFRAHRRLDPRAARSSARWPGIPRSCVVDAAAPLAFCAGWLRPRVYVSTGALGRLSESELRAVLAHEQHHRALRDPLRLAVGRVLCQALFFLPVLRPLHDRYGDVAELNADAAALDATGGAAAPLASALLAFGATSAATSRHLARAGRLAARPAGGLATARLLLMTALVTIAAFVALVWRASAGASVAGQLNLPIASSQPCLLVLALVPVLACLAGAAPRRADPRFSGRLS